MKENGSPLIFTIAIVFNLGWLVYYFYTMAQSRQNNKLVITGELTGITEQEGKYKRLDIFMGLESFYITTGEQKRDFKLGETVSLHYVLKQNGSKGTLIKVEKIAS